jgi:ribosomal protein L37AE/L43A
MARKRNWDWTQSVRWSPPACPECRSGNVERYMGRGWKCLACGHEFVHAVEGGTNTTVAVCGSEAEERERCAEMEGLR